MVIFMLLPFKKLTQNSVLVYSLRIKVNPVLSFYVRM